MNLRTEIEIFKVLRERLKTEFGLADDDESLLDTLEGETKLQEVIVQIIREAQRAKVFANGLKHIIADNIERLSRFEKKYEKLRELAAEAMNDAGLKKITTIDMTITQRPGQPLLKIADNRPPDSTTPFTNGHITYSWDKDALRKAISIGDQRAMAIAYTTSNQELVLTVRPT